MALPYTTLRPTEEVIIAGLPIKKLGCVTVAEMQAAADIDANNREKLQEMTPIQADIYIKQLVSTVLIRSRLDRNWTMEQTQADEWDVIIDGKLTKIEPDMVLLSELYEFFLNEQRRWASDEESTTEDNEPEKKRTGRKSTGG